MTYKRMKSIASGLLVGDNVLPQDDDQMLGLVELAFHDIATNSLALRLLTLNEDANILRLGTGDYLTRSPELPENPDEELDIDNELGFVCARLIASYLSKTKSRAHEFQARRLISDYNAKVTELQESINLNADGVAEVMFDQGPQS